LACGDVYNFQLTNLQPEASYNSYITTNIAVLKAALSVEMNIVSTKRVYHLRLNTANTNFGGTYIATFSVDLEDFDGINVPSAWIGDYPNKKQGSFTTRFEIYDPCIYSTISSTDHNQAFDAVLLESTTISWADFTSSVAGGCGTFVYSATADLEYI